MRFKNSKFKIFNFNSNLKLKNKYSQKGFTLVEMILYFGLLAIFLLILSQIFVSILDVRNESDATSSVEQDGRFILARLHYDISRADSITTPANVGDSNDSLVLGVSSSNVSYTLSGPNFMLTDSLGSAQLNSSQTTVSSVSFQKIGNTDVASPHETIKVQFTLTGVTIKDSGVETKTFMTTVGRR